MVLGKLPVPGRPTYLDWSRARAYCACSRCGWGVVWTFVLSSIIPLFFLPPLGEGPILTEILSQRAAKSKTNQPTNPHYKSMAIATKLKSQFSAKTQIFNPLAQECNR